MRYTAVMATIGVVFSTGGSTGLYAQIAAPALSEVARIGQVDGPAALTEVGDIVIVGDTLFVAQPRERVIRRFLTSGEVLPVLGGRGEGPGEFGGIESMARVGDSLVILDRRNRRVTLMDLSGDLIHTRVLQEPPARIPIVYGGSAYPAARGRVVTWADIPVTSAREVPRLPIVLATPEGQILDTLGSFRTCVDMVCVTKDGGGSVFPRPLFDHPKQVVSGDGGYFVEIAGTDETLQLRWVRLTSLQRNTTPLPPLAVEVPPSYSDSLIDLYRSRLGGVGAPVAPRDVRDLMALPERLHNPDAAFVRSGGEVWYRIPAFAARSHDKWVAVRPDGRTRTFAVPHGVTLKAEDGRGRLWGVMVDALGVSYLVALSAPGA